MSPVRPSSSGRGFLVRAKEIASGLDPEVRSGRTFALWIGISLG